MYTLYWVNRNGQDSHTCLVMAEDYPSIDAAEPIPDTLRVVSGNHSETEARKIVTAKQRGSYSENRRQSNGA